MKHFGLPTRACLRFIWTQFVVRGWGEWIVLNSSDKKKRNRPWNPLTRDICNGCCADAVILVHNLFME